jgi:hypothetical protein
MEGSAKARAAGTIQSRRNAIAVARYSAIREVNFMGDLVGI